MNIIEYLKIPYKHLGRTKEGTDCFGLVQLFYNTEFSISLADFENYAENWATSGANLISKNYKAAGFKPIKFPKFGDLVTIREHKGVVSHLGVVTDNQYFLHTTRDGTCQHSYVAGHWANRVDQFLTYKGK